MIICGFAGIGKSTVAKKYPGWVDLESTPFCKNWSTYVDVAEHMNNSGYNVMLSCHKELREELLKREIPFCVIVPEITSFWQYIDNYKNRGNTKSFIENMTLNFIPYIQEIEEDDRLKVCHLSRGKYMENFVNELVSNINKLKLTKERETIEKDKITAVYSHPECGFCKPENLIEGSEYEVTQITIGQSYSNIMLKGIKGSFNTVNFDFYKNGERYDIFKDKTINHYL